MYRDEWDHSEPVYHGLVRHLFLVDCCCVEPENEPFEDLQK